MDKQLTDAVAQAHKQDKHITLALFGVAVKEDLELAQHIISKHAQDYEQHIQMHMRNMIDAQLKLNAANDVLTRILLKHALTMLEQEGDGIAHTAAQATHDLLGKFKLH